LVAVNNVGVSYEIPSYLHEIEDNKVILFILLLC